MLKRIKAWLRARLHIKIDYTIPGTEIRVTATVHRITGLVRLDWSVPQYILAVEKTRLALPNRPTPQIRVIPPQPRPGSQAARASRSTFN